jgi:sRNA-binding regulator protein Hfq
MRVLSLLLVALLIFSSVGFADQPALAPETPQGQAEETPQVARFKAEVQKHGTGEKSKVRVTLGNGVTVKGYISKIEESSFEVIANKTGQATSISYTDVKKIQGPGLSTGAKIGIGVAIGIGALALITWVAVSHLKINL